MGLIIIAVVAVAIPVGVFVLRIVSARSDRRRQAENARR